MSDDADIRAVLREHGYDPPARGRLSEDWLERHAEIIAGTAEGPDPDATEADPPPDTAGSAQETPAAEQRPRRPGRTRTRRQPLTDRLKGARGKAKPGRGGRAKPKHPRVPVDRLTGMLWEALGRMFTPISPPTGRCLQLQAPVAGLLMEDVVKGTMADRFVQPWARAEEKGKKVLAVAAPPMIVLALEQAQGLPDAQRQVREAFLLPMLLESLMMWDDVAGEKIEEQMARAEREGPRRERAERIMAMIFAPPTPAGPATSSEDEQAAQAQQTVGV